MKIKATVTIEIDEQQYIDTYKDSDPDYSRELHIDDMYQDILGSAQNGVKEWGKALSFKFKIKNEHEANNNRYKELHGKHQAQIDTLINKIASHQSSTMNQNIMDAVNDAMMKIEMDFIEGQE
tara:strand:+ start:788 stop:1156 length:369 start_codon:yes stop_codon:yes gene_type:complete